MQINVSDKKGSGESLQKYIGYFKGSWTNMNPSSEEIKDIYKLEDVPEKETEYQGVDKNQKDWSLLRFVFTEEINRLPVEYRIFLSKEVAEFEKDGITKTWYINQLGETQIVSDKKDLFRGFTHLQKWDNVEKKMDDALDDGGKPVELSWRKAWRGEKQLYDLLKKMASEYLFKADIETKLSLKLINFDALMRGKVKDILTWVGEENLSSVVGNVEIQAKDSDSGTNYYQNCTDGAWMPGYKIKDANIATSTGTWSKYEVKHKGKEKEIYEFYQAIRRSRNITDLKYLHPFVAGDHLAAGNETIKHDSSEAAADTDY